MSVANLTLTLTLSKPACFVDCFSTTVPQHPAHNVSIFYVPNVIAHCPPSKLVEHFHSTLVRPGAVDQPYRSFFN